MSCLTKYFFPWPYDKEVCFSAENLGLGSSIFQREALEDEFNELMKDASSDVQEKMKQELENAAPSAGSDVTDDGDEHIVLEEYLSDTEQQKNSDSEDEAEDENDHITKVTVL